MATALPGSIEWYQQMGYPIILPTSVSPTSSPAAAAGVVSIPSAIQTAGGAPAIAGVPSLPSATTQAPAAASGIMALLGGSVVAAIRWLITQFGLRAIITAILSAIGFAAIANQARDDDPGGLDSWLAAIIPGQQAFLGEFPAGMGELGGRIVKTWTAGGARVYFCMVEKPTRSGSTITPYVYSAKRGCWLPFSFPRNVVFGKTELEVAAALSGRKRISKKRALRALAGRTPRRTVKKEDNS